MALATRQSLREIQEDWTDEDLVTVVQLLEDRAREQDRAMKRQQQRGGRRRG